jgi:protein-S-isoprenylcysteine O-methyltransferase Ste14
MEVSGKPAVHPALFISGKAAGYFAWGVLFLSLTGLSGLNPDTENYSFIVSQAMLYTGIALILASSFTLGRSIRIGLPTEETVLRTGGIYGFSRNPMYLGVHLVTLAAMMIHLKWWVALPGIFSIAVYHLIVLGEEKFLEGRFGKDYLDYKQQTRRYI